MHLGEVINLIIHSSDNLVVTINLLNIHSSNALVHTGLYQLAGILYSNEVWT